MPKYSVIIPVYNAEMYLKRCLDSVLGQTFCDFELIAIDDGSTDDSGDICDEYAHMDNRVKVIHQKNQGVSSARNCGLINMCGSRVIFVDADDYLSHDYLHVLDNAESDFVIASFESGENKETVVEKDKEYVFNNTESIIDILNTHFLLTVWAKVYKTSIIKNNNIFFDESLNYGEDTVFNNTYIKHIITACSVSYVGYHHAVDNTMSLSQSQLTKPLIDRTEYIEKLFDLWKTVPKIQEFWANRFLWNVELELKRIVISNLRFYEKKKEIKKLINSDIFKQSFILVPDYFSTLNKLLINKKFYSLILHKYMKSKYNKNYDG